MVNTEYNDTSYNFSDGVTTHDIPGPIRRAVSLELQLAPYLTLELSRLFGCIVSTS